MPAKSAAITVDYLTWRNDIFGQNPDRSVASVDLLPETYKLSVCRTFDHIDRALADPEIHDLFRREQIGIGLQLIYQNGYSDICFCYVETADEKRRIVGIQNLVQLYENFLKRYCAALISSIGGSSSNSEIDSLCYMFWDIFILSEDSSPPIAAAALHVMEHALYMSNESCIASAIHGLGHWALYNPRAPQILRQWLRRPTSRNPALIEYAKQAVTGGIM